MSEYTLQPAGYPLQSALPAIEGMAADSGFGDKISCKLTANVKQVASLSLTTCVAAVAQESTLTVDTAADADAYTLQIGEFFFSGTTAGTNATTQAGAIRTQLNADANFLTKYSVGGSGADVVITALRPGVAFNVHETVETSSAWSWATGTANVVGTQIKLTLDGHEVIFPCDSTTEEDERDSLLAVLEANAYFAALVDMAVDDSADPVFKLTFTAKTAGVPFTLTFSNSNVHGIAGSGTAALAAVTANVTGNPVPYGRVIVQGATEEVGVLPSVTGQVVLGISLYNAQRSRQYVAGGLTTQDPQYYAGDMMTVGRKMRVQVRPETAVVIGDAVYFRFTQGTDPLHTVGRLRASADSGKTDALTGARWVTACDAEGLAILQLP